VLALIGMLLPDLQGDADYIVALLLQQSRGYGAIYSAAHCGYYNSLVHLIIAQSARLIRERFHAQGRCVLRLAFMNNYG
jgi:hypothetical protein